MRLEVVSVAVEQSGKASLMSLAAFMAFGYDEGVSEGAGSQ